ncbi:Death-associated inhibitor of apoptosis 1 [Gryllus bimaculatus]|nr:Death-associated inhibitor of apoptosis 1 [Gryllus bimaculatus]
MASRQLNLADENERYSTFRTWPNPNMRPHELSANGFYYTNYQDIVKCFACGLELGDWQLGDDPFLEHQNWRPNCPFLRDFFMNDIRHREDFVSHTHRIHVVSEVCPLHARTHQNDNNGVNMVQNALEMLGINETGPPVHSVFVSPGSRLQSFKTWPISMKLRPERLCEAGFFYSGHGDKTVCFHCGKEVSNWTDGDDPWVEHARWSPKCSYVILNQGRDFVENVTGNARSPADSMNLRDVNIPAELRDSIEIRENAEIENPSNQEPVGSQPESQAEAFQLDSSQPGASTGAVKKSGKSGGSKSRRSNSTKAKASKGSFTGSKSSDKDNRTATAKSSVNKEKNGEASKKDESLISDDRLCKICWQEQLESLPRCS